MTVEAFDVIVIGAGPAGVSGAIAAAMMGARTALIEREDQVGGAGINTGTIPSKTLRETALALSGARSRRLHGVDLSLRREASVADFTRHRDNVTTGERSRIESRLARFGVTRIRGSASFVDPHTLRVVAGDGIESRISADIIL